MKTTIKIHDRARELHRVVVENLFRLKNELSSMSLEEILDVAYGLKETASLLNDSRKECEDVMKMMGQVMCVMWVQKNINTGCDDPIRSEHAIGTPHVKKMMHLPKTDTDEYTALMRYMGVKEGALVRPHWPSIVDHVTELLSNGKEAPPGMTGKIYDIHTVIIRKRKDFHYG